MKDFSSKKVLAFILSAAMAAGNFSTSVALAEEVPGESFMEEGFSDGFLYEEDMAGGLESAAAEEILDEEPLQEGFSGAEEMGEKGFTSWENGEAEEQEYEADGARKPVNLELGPEQRTWQIYDMSGDTITTSLWSVDDKEGIKVLYDDGTEDYTSDFDVEYTGTEDDDGNWLEGEQTLLYSCQGISMEFPIYVVHMERNGIILSQDESKRGQDAGYTAAEYEYYSFTPQKEGVYEFAFSEVSGSGRISLYRGEDECLVTDQMLEGNKKVWTELEGGKTYYLVVSSIEEDALQYCLTASAAESDMELDKDYCLGEGDDFFLYYTPDKDGFYQFETNGTSTTLSEGSTILWTFEQSCSAFLRAGTRYGFHMNSWSGGVFRATFAEEASLEDGAAAFRNENISATISKDGVLSYTGSGALDLYLTLWNKEITSVVIGEGITTIDYFGNQQSLTSVRLPSTLVEVAPYAFYMCENLSDIEFPNPAGLKKIGAHAFTGTPFAEKMEKSGDFRMLGNIAVAYDGMGESAVIPERAVVLADCAMQQAKSVKNLTILQNLKELGRYSVSECSSLQEVKVPGNVTSIGYGAFSSDTALENVVLEEGVKEVGARAFYDCNALESIVIPKSVTSIGSHAIGYKRVQVEEHIFRNEKDDTPPLIKCYSGTAGYAYAVENALPYSLLDPKPTPTPTTAPVTPTVVPTQAPANPTPTIAPTQAPATPMPKPTALKKGSKFISGNNKYQVTGTKNVSFIGLKSKKTSKVSIPSSVKYGGITYSVTAVGSKALYKNAYVTQITVGNKVTSIGTYAFAGCKKLKRVTLGTGVKTIGKYAMKSCTRLSSITIKSTKLTSVKSGAFKSIYAKATIKVPSKKLSAYKKLLKNKGLSSKARIKK